MGKLADALFRHADLDGRRVAMSDDRCVLPRSELAQWVAGAAADLGAEPEMIGIFGANSAEWAVAFLAASVAGKTIVPIPRFFSQDQRAHLLRDAGVSRILVSEAADKNGYGLTLPVQILSQRREAMLPLRPAMAASSSTPPAAREARKVSASPAARRSGPPRLLRRRAAPRRTTNIFRFCRCPCFLRPSAASSFRCWLVAGAL